MKTSSPIAWNKTVCKFLLLTVILLPVSALLIMGCSANNTSPVQTTKTSVNTTTATTTVKPSTTATTTVKPSITATTSIKPATITLSPTSGEPGTEISINGNGFTPGAKVASSDIWFNGMPCTGETYDVNTVGHVEFVLTIADDTPRGKCDVVVTDSSGKKAISAFMVTGPPAITLFPPYCEPGTQITLNGDGFNPGATIKFSSDLSKYMTAADLNKLTADSTGHFSCSFEIPANTAPGIYSINAEDSSGTSASEYFTVTGPPAITFYPLSGCQGGYFSMDCVYFTPGATMKLTGTLFDYMKPENMKEYLAIVEVDSDCHFQYSSVLPADIPPGEYTVIATDSYGKQATANFTVLTPAIVKISPPSGKPGTTFTIYGRYFTPGATIESTNNVWVSGQPLIEGPTFTVGSTGNVIFEIKTTKYITPGEYTVTVTDSSGKRGIGTFTITSP